MRGHMFGWESKCSSEIAYDLCVIKLNKPLCIGMVLALHCKLEVRQTQKQRGMEYDEVESVASKFHTVNLITLLCF